jgi:leucyl aminopeptidase (aminopeptidase T)
MRSSDLILLCTSFLVPQGLRREAADAGARLISMSGVDSEAIKRCFDVDYEELARNTKLLAEKIQSSKAIRCRTDNGTELEAELTGRKPVYLDGLARIRGQITALPAGVVAVAPCENTANGTIVIDGSIAEVGIVRFPVTCTVEEGRIVEIKGGREAKRLKRLLSADIPAGFCLAEVGAGTNPKAKYTGNLLEDERVYASCHVGFGRNSHIGGIIESKVHIDCTIKRPEIYVDDRKVVSSGRILPVLTASE